MTGSSAHSGSSVGDAVRKGVGLVHGTGEAIRGNVNAAVDTAAGDRNSAAKNEGIASRGVDEMEHGHYHGTGAGVTPVDTARERQNRAAQGEYSNHTHTGPTNYGPHATNTGNKLDPRYDSDLGTRSSNDGPHNTHKFDPNYDSDQDRRGTYAGYGLTDYGLHSTNVGNEIVPRYDFDLDATHDPIVDLVEDHGRAIGSSGPPHSSANPHKSNFLNLLDPRVDRNAGGGDKY
ncbi:hypothetical protein K505DRAFT_298410 [Melanomma pulvis-pyrius CBS 109.77]|uniref:Cell surface protein n=1 Tax=Melanomma pulvis-pyrius CBS 109.77 TaxID=1314802 RepID=A0A6A6XMJ2_9PLEO|nr:hypothetical protein K505DRAFT_298410 [Melanomma pulvis-pyrius CBS 109.77]